MAKILVVEDNNEINSLLCEMLHKEGIETISAYSGTEAMIYVNQNSFACILLDLMLPGKSGEEILQDIRQHCKTPVIVISAKDDMDNRIELLSHGADDYIMKPFDLREVYARVRLQMGKSVNAENHVIHYGEILLDSEKRTVTIGNQELNLTKQEFNILEILMKNPQKVFSKQELFESAWEEYYFGADKTMNVHISNIRNKLKQVTDMEYIDTVWGIGFRMATVD